MRGFDNHKPQVVLTGSQRIEREHILVNPSTLSSAGLLVLRLVVGVTFLLHGLDKLGDLSGTKQFFSSLGISEPSLMAPLVAVTETAGGVLLIAGLATPLVGTALAVDMLVAFVTAHIGSGFFVRDGGVELVLLLGGASVAIVLVGAGRFSLDARLGLPRGLSSMSALDLTRPCSKRARAEVVTGRTNTGNDLRRVV